MLVVKFHRKTQDKCFDLEVSAFSNGILVVMLLETAFVTVTAMQVFMVIFNFLKLF